MKKNILKFGVTLTKNCSSKITGGVTLFSIPQKKQKKTTKKQQKTTTKNQKKNKKIKRPQK